MITTHSGKSHHYKIRNALTSCYSCNLSSYPLPKWTEKELTSKYYYYEEYPVCFPNYVNLWTQNCHEKNTSTKQTRSLAPGHRVNQELNLQHPSQAVAPPASQSFWQLPSNVLAHTWSSHIYFSSVSKRNYALCHCYLLKPTFFSLSTSESAGWFQLNLMARSKSQW